MEDAGATSIACSAGVLTSLVSNLVGNAIKYMGDAPLRRVVVHARDVGSRVRIEVDDTGPGVPLELRDRIFEPYVRATESSVPGLGLGLATVRRLVDAHGGRLGMSSGATGSSFWFELPREAPQEEAHGRRWFFRTARRGV
jgi:signal transduction histidine kinase